MPLAIILLRLHPTNKGCRVKHQSRWPTLVCNSRGGHLYKHPDLGQEVKAENLEGQAVKGTSQIRKSQGSSTVKVNRIPNLIKARYHTFNSVKSKAYLSAGSSGQGPKLRSKMLTGRVLVSLLE